MYDVISCGKNTLSQTYHPFRKRC